MIAGKQKIRVSEELGMHELTLMFKAHHFKFRMDPLIRFLSTVSQISECRIQSSEKERGRERERKMRYLQAKIK